MLEGNANGLQPTCQARKTRYWCHPLFAFHSSQVNAGVHWVLVNALGHGGKQVDLALCVAAREKPAADKQ